MDFELRQPEQEFEIQKDGTITFNGARKEAYRKFYQSFRKKKGSPQKFLSIFEKFIKDCGFCMQGQQPVFQGSNVFIRELKDTLPAIGPIYFENVDTPHTVPPLGSFSWTISSNLNFICHPNSVKTECLMSIGGTGTIGKERADDLMRLAIFNNYPGLIEIVSTDKGYIINASDYSYLKTALILLTQTISSTNEIVMDISSAINSFIQDMKKKGVEKRFLDNLI